MPFSIQQAAKFFQKDKTRRSAPLRIIIVGIGKVGATLTEALSREGNDITVIDQSREVISDVTNRFDVNAVVGNGASIQTLRDAGVEEADLFIAVTPSDELNLLCCTIAKQSSSAATIARVRSPEYSNETAYLKQTLGLAMIINPDLEAAREISRILFLPSALEVNSFAHGQAELIKLRIPSGNPLDGMDLATFGRTMPSSILVCAIERSGDVIIPRGEDKLYSGDVISFVAPPKQARLFLHSIGMDSQQVDNCLMIGGGRTAIYLATLLMSMGISVKIIEQSRSRCEQLCEQLPGAIIINGDGTDAALLKEEGIETAQSFVAVTGIDEENILLSMHARSVSKAKTVTKVNRISFKDVLASLDLGSVIFPRFLTADAILAYARAKRASLASNIETLYHMFDDRAEALEFLVDRESDVTGTPLKDLNLKSNLVVCFILHDGKMLFPGGEDQIRVGDTVMIVTTHSGFTDITDILDV